MKFEEHVWNDRKGRTVVFRSGENKDAADLIAYMKQTAMETDYLLREVEEIRLDEAMERRFIEANQTPSKDVMIVILVDGILAGSCSVSGKGMLSRIRHRCELALALKKDCWGAGIGTKTMELFADAVKSAKTVVWNGPMGVFENPTLAKGTIAVAKSLAETDATTIIGGGDSAAAVNNLGFGDKMTHISTGGGASLEFLEGKELPGVVAANDKD